MWHKLTPTYVITICKNIGGFSEFGELRYEC